MSCPSGDIAHSPTPGGHDHRTQLRSSEHANTIGSIAGRGVGERWCAALTMLHPRAPKQPRADHNSRPPRLPQPMTFTDVTDCSRCQRYARDVASGTGEPPLVKCGALEIGLVRSSARAVEVGPMLCGSCIPGAVDHHPYCHRSVSAQEARHGSHSARPVPNTSMLLEEDLQRCLKAAGLLLARYTPCMLLYPV